MGDGNVQLYFQYGRDGDIKKRLKRVAALKYPGLDVSESKMALIIIKEALTKYESELNIQPDDRPEVLPAIDG